MMNGLLYMQLETALLKPIRILTFAVMFIMGHAELLESKPDSGIICLTSHIVLSQRKLG